MAEEVRGKTILVGTLLLIGVLVAGCAEPPARKKSSAPRKHNPGNPVQKDNPGRSAETLRELNRRIDRNPKDAVAYVKRGNLYFQQAEREKNPEKWYWKASEDYITATEIDPYLVEAYYNRAIASWRLNLPAASDSDLSIALEDNPGFVPALYAKGLIALHQGDYDEAIVHFEETLAADPDHAGAYAHRGLAKLGKGLSQEAALDVEEALRRDSDLSVGKELRGYLALTNGNHRRAIADFSAVLERNPIHAGVLFNRGLAYAAQKQYARAARDFRKFLQLAPESPEADTVSEWLRFAEQRDRDRASPEKEKPKKTSPKRKSAR